MKTSTKIRIFSFLTGAGLWAWVLIPVFLTWQKTGTAHQESLTTWQFTAGGLIIFISFYSGKFLRDKKKRYHDATGDSMSRANVMLSDDEFGEE